MHLKVYQSSLAAELRHLVEAVAWDPLSLPELQLIESEPDWRQWLNSADHDYQAVALDEGRVIGHIAVANHAGPELAGSWNGDTGALREVNALFVHPAARRQGVATDLLALAVAKIRLTGHMPGLVAYDDAPWALALYGSTGWRRLEATSAPPGLVIPFWFPDAS